MKTKSRIFDTFQNFICQAERQLGNKLKHLYTDFREKSANQTFREYTTKKDIK